MFIIYVALGIVLGLIIYNNLEAIFSILLGLSKLAIVGVCLITSVASIVLLITSGVLIDLLPMILIFAAPLILILVYMFLAILLDKKVDDDYQHSSIKENQHE